MQREKVLAGVPRTEIGFGRGEYGRCSSRSGRRLGTKKGERLSAPLPSRTAARDYCVTVVRFPTTPQVGLSGVTLAGSDALWHLLQVLTGSPIVFLFARS